MEDFGAHVAVRPCRERTTAAMSLATLSAGWEATHSSQRSFPPSDGPASIQVFPL